MDISIVDYSADYLDIIYRAGRGCYGLEFDNIELGIKQRKKIFLKNLIKNKHESVLEHCHISISITGCSRSFMAQITRHRLASFSIKSQHFLNHTNFEYKELETDNNEVENRYHILMENIREHYKYFVEHCNIPIYVAREILPNSCLTNIFMTANFREWRYIIKLRQTNKNTPEMIVFATTIKKMFVLIAPEVFEDL